MKSLKSFIIESYNTNSKYTNITPEQVIVIFGDDVKNFYDKPGKYTSKEQLEILGHFTNNFSHFNITKRHFKTHKYNIPLKKIVTTDNASEIILNDAKKHNIDNVRYLLAFITNGGTEYKIACIDLIEHEYCSIVRDASNKESNGTVDSKKFDVKGKFSDLKSNTYLQNWMQLSSTKYVLVSDSFYRK